MKKYNKLFMILPICMMQLHAMEISDPSKPDPRGICHFARMPIEVYKRIEYFLPWETQKKFIARMREKKNSFSHELSYTELDNRTKYFACVVSADQDKKMTIDLLPGESHKSKINIFGRFNNSRILVKTSHIIMPYNWYLHAAIACSGDIFAFIHKKDRPSASEQTLSYYPHMLMVHKVKEKETVLVFQFEFPQGYAPLKIDFNYQGTHVYTAGNQYNNKGDIRKKDKIFSLKVSDVYRDKEINQDNGLQQYLKYHCVCKGLIRASEGKNSIL